MLLIELAGNQGAGKSTLAPLIAQRLRESFGADQVAALPEKDLKRRQRRWTRFKRWFWLITNPAAVRAAKAIRQVEPNIASFDAWKRLFSTMGIGRQALRQGVQVVVVDQGILRTPLQPQHVDHLPRSLMPDLVLQLVADPAVIELRRIQRDKPVLNPHGGEARLQAARQSRWMLSSLPEPELRTALRQFGNKFCTPPLSEAEIDELLSTPAPPPRTSQRCVPETCERLRQIGVRWEIIDTSRHRDIEESLACCLNAVRTHLNKVHQNANA